MEFLPNVKYVAEAIQDFPDYVSEAIPLGYCNHYFQKGGQYELELTCLPRINNYGEVTIDFEARILDGSLDGYDRPCGVEFHNAEAFNRYFRVKEAEGN